MNLSTKQIQTHKHREQTCDCEEGGWVGEGQTGNLGLANANYYIYVQLNHFAVHQKLTQHYKSTVLQLKKKFFFSGHTTRHAGPQSPDQGSNPRPLQWKQGVLTIGPPGKSLNKIHFLKKRKLTRDLLRIYTVLFAQFEITKICYFG